MIRAVALPLVLALVSAACGGSPPPEGDGPARAEPAPEEEKSPEERERARELARLRAAQESACAKMCPELTDCAVEDARENMSEEELAELDLEKTAPRHTAKCESECMASDLSPRQVTVIQNCLTQGGDCAAFRDCLDAAQKGAGGASPSS